MGEFCYNNINIGNSSFYEWVSSVFPFVTTFLITLIEHLAVVVTYSFPDFYVEVVCENPLISGLYSSSSTIPSDADTTIQPYFAGVIKSNCNPALVQSQDGDEVHICLCLLVSQISTFR